MAHDTACAQRLDPFEQLDVMLGVKTNPIRRALHLDTAQPGDLPQRTPREKRFSASHVQSIPGRAPANTLRGDPQRDQRPTRSCDGGLRWSRHHAKKTLRPGGGCTGPQLSRVVRPWRGLWRPGSFQPPGLERKPAQATPEHTPLPVVAEPPRPGVGAGPRERARPADDRPRVDLPGRSWFPLARLTEQGAAGGASLL
jgi:hypothetical protein